MSRYADVDIALKHAIKMDWSVQKYVSEVDLVSSINPNVAPVVHGHWEITDAYPHNVYCSVCHKRYAQTHWKVWEDGTLPRNYCPNCNAKMDEVTE